MPADYLIRPTAEREMDEGYYWYENSRPGRGKKFLVHVTRTIESICRTPLVGRAVTERIRKVVVPKFPYAVYYAYEASQNLVIVYSVFHESQDQGKMVERLQE